jgi:hypothetical protein
MSLEISDMMKWSRPKLVVLARINPEEAVLAGCKHKKANPMNPNVADIGCRRVTLCAPCNLGMNS